MAKNNFIAILAKNTIAREIAHYKLTGEPLSANVILEQLESIEVAIGVGNQPSVKDIIENNSDRERKFNI